MTGRGVTVDDLGDASLNFGPGAGEGSASRRVGWLAFEFHGGSYNHREHWPQATMEKNKASATIHIGQPRLGASWVT